MEKNSAVYPAASVIVLRKDFSGEGFEVLLLKRNPELVYLGGTWVFPGGRIDQDDYAAGGDDSIETAKNAAIREVKEESGFDVDIMSLIPVSKWLTPVGMPRRFSTWFFITIANDVTVRVDGGEIVDHIWLKPSEALKRQQDGQIELPPPNYVTLNHLAHFTSPEKAVSCFGSKGPLPEYKPRLISVDGGMCSLYQEDAGYQSGNVDAPGTRHRLWMLSSGWNLECQGGTRYCENEVPGQKMPFMDSYCL